MLATPVGRRTGLNIADGDVSTPAEHAAKAAGRGSASLLEIYPYTKLFHLVLWSVDISPKAVLTPIQRPEGLVSLSFLSSNCWYASSMNAFVVLTGFYCRSSQITSYIYAYFSRPEEWQPFHELLFSSLRHTLYSPSVRPPSGLFRYVNSLAVISRHGSNNSSRDVMATSEAIDL